MGAGGAAAGSGVSVRLDEPGLDAYTDDFLGEAFRHEVLPAYEVPSDGGDFARYMAGEQHPDPKVVEPYRAWILAQIARGAAVRAVRVLREPPGNYLRYECEWGYAFNVAAGMEVRVLDLTDQTAPPAFVDEEFWLLDRGRAAVLHYDEKGRFLHADTAEGDAATRYRVARDAAWDAGEPFISWWSRHPEYHRSLA